MNTFNKQLRIKRIKDVKFYTADGYYLITDWVLIHDTLGYISDDGVVPYLPQGGKRALKSIIEGGGYLNTDGLHFIEVATC